jgi:hypothetical protein
VDPCAYDTYVRNPLSRATRSCRWRPTRGDAHVRAGQAAAAGAVLGRPRVGDRVHRPRPWKLAFANLRRPEAASGFVARFIDPAFNDCIFMWDSCFMTLFGRYGARAFPFVRTLDNSVRQAAPGRVHLPRDRPALGDDRFPRFDPSSTGPT